MTESRALYGGALGRRDQLEYFAAWRSYLPFVFFLIVCSLNLKRRFFVFFLWFVWYSTVFVVAYVISKSVSLFFIFYVSLAEAILFAPHFPAPFAFRSAFCLLLLLSCLAQHATNFLDAVGFSSHSVCACWSFGKIVVLLRLICRLLVGVLRTHAHDRYARLLVASRSRLYGLRLLSLHARAHSEKKNKK